MLEIYSPPKFPTLQKTFLSQSQVTHIDKVVIIFENRITKRFIFHLFARLYLIYIDLNTLNSVIFFLLAYLHKNPFPKNFEKK